MNIRFYRAVVSAFAALGASLSAVAGLPYIQSDGVDDWIDTGFVATPRSKVVVELELVSTANSQYLFGAQTDNTAASDHVAVGVHISGKNFYTVWSGPQSGTTAFEVSTVLAANDKKVRITIDRQDQQSGIRIVGLGDVGSANAQVMAPKNCPVDTAYPLAIFAMRSGANAYSFTKMKLYSFVCYENGAVVHHFVPYRSGDTVGLRDLVTGDVHENKGSGALTYGEDPDEVKDPHLDSFDAQWIYTGYVVKSNSLVELDCSYRKADASRHACGADLGSGDQRFVLFSNGSKVWSVIVGNQQIKFASSVNCARDKVVVDRKKRVTTLSRNGEPLEQWDLSDSGRPTPFGMALFGCATSETSVKGQCSLRLYSCRVYEYEDESANPALKHEYLPYVAFDGAACLRDSQTGEAFRNCGTLEFVYFASDAAHRPDALTVVGYEDDAMGQDVPCSPAGLTVGYAAGESVNATVARDAFVDSSGKNVTLRGWQVCTNAVDGQWTVWSEGTTTNCTFTHPGRAVRLKWLWDVETTSVDIRDLSADGAGGDTIALTGRLEAFEGATCTFRVQTGSSPTEMTYEWTDLEGLERTEAGDFSFTLHEHDTTAGRYLAPGSTVYVVVEATAGGRTVRCVPIAVNLKSAAVYDVITVEDSQRTLTVSGKMADVGMHGDEPPRIEIWGGTADDPQTFTKVADAGLSTETFSLDWTVTEFDVPYYWQLRVQNQAAGGTASETPTSEVKTNTLTDRATYLWKASVATGVWDRAESWTSDKPDCVGYPKSSGSIALFSEATTARVEVARSVSIDKFDISAKKLDLTFVAADGPVDICMVRFPAIGDQGSSRWDSSFAFDGVSFVLPSNNDLTFAVGSGSSLGFAHGAEMYRQGEDRKADFVRIHLRDKSSTEVTGFPTYRRGLVDFGEATAAARLHCQLWIGGEGVFRTGRPVSCDNVYVAQASGGGGGTVELYGHGAMTVTSEFRGSTSAANVIDTQVNFFVPEAGYAVAPLVGTSVNPFGGGETMDITTKIRLAVPMESPLFRTQGKREVPLVSWPSGITTNRIAFEACPRNRSASYLYYTYDDKGKATGVSLHYDGAPGFMLIIK